MRIGEQTVWGLMCSALCLRACEAVYIYIVASARKGGQFGARSHGELKRIGAQPLEPPRTSVARAAENLCGPF